MFSIPGFNVGSLVVEAPKEQLKKRKHESDTTTATSSSSTTVSTTTTSTPTVSTSTSSTTTSSSAGTILPIAASTSNAPFSKKFKKEPVFEKRAPSEPKLGWGWIPEPVPLKERATWNQSTKALRKAKAEEEKAKREKAIEEKKNLVSSINAPSTAVELLLNGSVDMKDIATIGNPKKTEEDTEQSGEGGKKRNKRLERKIKRAAYVVALEAKEKESKINDSAAAVDTDVTMTEATNGDAAEKTTDGAEAEVVVAAEGGDGVKKPKKKQQMPKTPLSPELAKLTNKERRMLKQLQKKQAEEGVDPLAKPAPVVAQTTPKAPKEKKEKKEKKAQQETKAVEQTKAAAPAEKATKSTKSKKAATTPTTEKKADKADNVTSKKQQQLAKEREKLLEALSRTNNALEELQKSLGDGEDDAPMGKADVQSAVQGKKGKKEKKAAAPTPAPAAPVAASASQTKQPKLTKLQEQMKKTLAGGKFRFLNEQLYTTTGEEAFGLFQSKPELFDEYHEGFRSQVELWPQNPVDIFISQLRSMSKDTVIADMGCGDAQISAELPKHNVLSFDLVAKNERVTACDIAHLPLADNSVDVAIFCLSLMGTDFLKFLKEAYRVLKPNGQLKISEVISRFTDVDAFVDALKQLGFELKNSDSSNKMFIMFDFIKPDLSAAKKGKKSSKKQAPKEDPQQVDLDSLNGPSLLKPCIYKRR